MTFLSKAYIGLGANLGDPIQQLVDARVRLAALPATMSCRCSPLYVSSPVGYSDQADFVNCVLELETQSDVRNLFSSMQLIEQALGRVREVGNQNAPRTIDIDLLMFADLEINQTDLIIPHPRLRQRMFVLKPLRDLGVNIAACDETDLSDQVLHKLCI